MRIAFLTSGRLVPSSRFRILPFIPDLERVGHDCLILPSRPEKYASLPFLGFQLSGLLKRRNRRCDLATLKRWSPDVVVLERELFSDATIDVEQALRRIARRLVLDIDDGLFVLNRRKFEMLCGLSDHVIAGNDLLADRVRPINPRVTVIPTCVDLPRYETAVRSRGKNSPAVTHHSPLTLGWTGTAANISYLEALRKPLQTLSREFAFELRVIAEWDRPLRQLRFEEVGISTRFVRWSEATEVADLHDLDVGLMPMPDTEWTRYKCGLKILQYMAAGVPAVASPVGVNSQIIHHGENGWLAKTPDDWLTILQRLLSDADLRHSVVPAAKQTVAENYSIQVQFPRLASCLEAVVSEQ